MPKVLLIENDKHNREMVKYILKKKGFEVIEAINGQAGVERAINEKPDLVLMDIQLPIMNGFIATKLLRNNSETKNIPIIAVSAHVMNGDREKAFNAGFTDYLIKPFTIAKFLAMVSGYV